MSEIPRWLREEIETAGGAIPFRRFMELALHHPRHGYYARRILTVGARGDFSTAATLSPALGRAIADWIRQHRGFSNVIEVGAGDGSLAATVRKALPWSRRLRYRIVETSEPLIERQRARLGRWPRWHATLPDALEACGGRALIFHNELVDAFPVSRWKLTSNRWGELGLKIEEGRLLETIVSHSDPPTVAAHWSLPEGQIIESHETYRDWLASWRPFWRDGFMLTIDYGAAEPALYRRRPQGTVRAYLLHQRLEGAAIYQNAGRQDLTADVNFADLVRWGEELGLETTRHRCLAEFLQPFVKQARDQALADRAGAGGAFRVLEQRAGAFPVANAAPPRQGAAC